MARKSKTPPPPLTREQEIEHTINDSRQFRDITEAFVSEPERTWEVGDQVRFGGWAKSVVIRKLNNKQYVLESVSDKGEQKFNVAWWTSIRDVNPKTISTQFATPEPRGQNSVSSFDSIIHMYESHGLVCDPTYQRGYVWNDFDREQLLDSVFERMDIGSFIFIRNHGYLHDKSDAVKEYITIEGTRVTVAKKDDYTINVIDGQQRITTLLRFWQNKFRYRGILFTELHYMDKFHFMQQIIKHRMINEEEVSRAELLKLFIQTNRGVPQAPEHLDKIRAEYEMLSKPKE